jgi:hypothetical protein
MTKKNNYNEASNQAWPSFVDILSSTIVVLCFALLIVVIVLSVSTVSSSQGTNSDQSSPSEIRVQTDILGEFRAEFQKVLIISNPSLRKEIKIENRAPTVDALERPIFTPNPSQVEKSPSNIQEPGDSQKQVLGDIPKNVDSMSVEVLKELIIVQRDVIEQQRKVIEQQDNEIVETTREYQSLLSLVTKEKEVEDIRQNITPKIDQALFVNTDSEQEKLSGPEPTPSGSSRYSLNKAEQPKTEVVIFDKEDSTNIAFKDNSQFLLEKSYLDIKNNLLKKVALYQDKGVVIEATISDFAVSEAEAQRIAVDRLLIFRSILLEIGVPASAVKLKTVSSNKEQNVNQEESYGSITIKANN